MSQRMMVAEIRRLLTDWRQYQQHGTTSRSVAFPWRVQLSTLELLVLPDTQRNVDGEDIRKAVLLCGMDMRDQAIVHIYFTSKEDLQTLEEAFFPQGPGSIELPAGMYMYISTLVSRDHKHPGERPIKYTLGRYKEMEELTSSIEEAKS